MNYKGTIIEESLENADVLKKVNILSTEVEPIEDSHQTPWLKQWTLHKVEVAEENAGEVAREISENLDSSHNSNWYADYKNDKWHYVIFPFKVFKVNKKDQAQYDEVNEYGVSLGIPDYQMGLSTDAE